MVLSSEVLLMLFSIWSCTAIITRWQSQLNTCGWLEAWRIFWKAKSSGLFLISAESDDNFLMNLCSPAFSLWGRIFPESISTHLNFSLTAKQTRSLVLVQCLVKPLYSCAGSYLARVPAGLTEKVHFKSDHAQYIQQWDSRNGLTGWFAPVDSHPIIPNGCLRKC